MDKLTGLLKEHQVGEWCKRAAWIMAAIGLIEIALTLYSLISELQQTNKGYNFSLISEPLQTNMIYNLPPAWGPTTVYTYLAPLFANIAQLIFFFFALYAAGVFLNHFVANTEANSKEEKDEQLDEEEGEYLQPGQFTEIQ